MRWMLLGILAFLTLLEGGAVAFFAWRFIAGPELVRAEAIKPMLVGSGGFAFFGFLTIVLWRKYTQGAKQSANKSA